MSILGGCVLAVLLGIVGLLAGSTLKSCTKSRSDDVAFWIGVLTTAILVGFAVAGGAAHGRTNPGLWKNISIGVLMWFFSGAVLMGWAVFILGIDAGDALKTVGLSLAAVAAVTLFLLLIHDVFLGRPFDEAMKLMLRASDALYRAIGRRVWLR